MSTTPYGSGRIIVLSIKVKRFLAVLLSLVHSSISRKSPRSNSITVVVHCFLKNQNLFENHSKRSHFTTMRGQFPTKIVGFLFNIFIYIFFNFFFFEIFLLFWNIFLLGKWDNFYHFQTLWIWFITLPRISFLFISTSAIEASHLGLWRSLCRASVKRPSFSSYILMRPLSCCLRHSTLFVFPLEKAFRRPDKTSA